MSTSVTPATNTSNSTQTPSTPLLVQNTISSAIPVTSATTTDIKKTNSNKLEKVIVHEVVQGIFIFIIALFIIGLIGYFLFSHEDEAFRFRELFYPNHELVPKNIN